MSEWAVSAGRAVGVVSGCGRGRGGVRVGELLLVLLLKQIMVPVVLLPLRVHGGWSKCHWNVEAKITVVSSKLKNGQKPVDQ